MYLIIWKEFHACQKDQCLCPLESKSSWRSFRRQIFLTELLKANLLDGLSNMYWTRKLTKTIIGLKNDNNLYVNLDVFFHNSTWNYSKSRKEQTKSKKWTDASKIFLILCFSLPSLSLCRQSFFQAKCRPNLCSLHSFEWSLGQWWAMMENLNIADVLSQSVGDGSFIYYRISRFLSLYCSGFFVQGSRIAQTLTRLRKPWQRAALPSVTSPIDKREIGFIVKINWINGLLTKWAHVRTKNACNMNQHDKKCATACSWVRGIHENHRCSKKNGLPARASALAPDSETFTGAGIYQAAALGLLGQITSSVRHFQWWFQMFQKFLICLELSWIVLIYLDMFWRVLRYFYFGCRRWRWDWCDAWTRQCGGRGMSAGQLGRHNSE